MNRRGGPVHTVNERTTARRHFLVLQPDIRQFGGEGSCHPMARRQISSWAGTSSGLRSLRDEENSTCI